MPATRTSAAVYSEYIWGLLKHSNEDRFYHIDIIVKSSSYLVVQNILIPCITIISVQRQDVEVGILSWFRDAARYVVLGCLDRSRP